jgi:hypothetical protein
MRDSGYRDIRKALNDLIDNAEQAEAQKIAIVTTAGKEDHKNAREKITNIAVVDDGHGMFPEMLPVAVKWGGTDRHNERDGLGRFGFGLPTASISVTRQYEVYSKVQGGKWYKVRVDLNEIAQAAMKKGGLVSYTLTPTETVLPEFVKSYIKSQWKKNDLEHGTVVLLINPDKIRRFATPTIFQAKMLQNIGLTYRHYMPATSFFVNEKKVEMIDPLFLNPTSIGYDAGNGLFAESIDDLSIRVKNTVNGKTIEGDISLRFSFMPPLFQRDGEGKEIKNRLNTMKENNGYFIVTRAGRQIDVVKDTDYQSDADNTTIVNYDANWAIELNFEPQLDELFGITTNKQQVEIDSSVWDLLKEHDIPAIVKSFRQKFQSLRVKAEIVDEGNKEENRDSEQIMSAAERFDKLRLPNAKEEKAEQKLIEEATTVSNAGTEDLEEATSRLRAEAEKQKYKVEFTSLPGAPFYDVEVWGPQVRVKINASHRFYTDVYSQQDNRGKTALELLLMVLAKCECEATDDRADFYGNERYEWSRKLDLRLKLLDKRDPILDHQSLVEESSE